MAKLVGYVVPRKPPSLKDNLVVSTWRGVAYVAKWPRKRGKNLPQITKDQNDWFRQANALTKYIAPQLQVVAREAVKGTPLYPRDVQIALMKGTLFSLTMDDGRKLYSMATVNAVSESLDVFGITPGGILVRNSQRWDLLPSGLADQVLTSQGPNLQPFWKSGGGGGGGGAWSSLGQAEVVAGVIDIQGLDFAGFKRLSLSLNSILPSVSIGHIDLQLYISGVLISSGYRWRTYVQSTSGSVNASNSTNYAAVRLDTVNNVWEVGLSPGAGMTLSLDMADPSGALNKALDWTGSMEFGTGNSGVINGVGQLADTGPVTGFRVTKNGGSLLSGNLTILGLA